jgi:hypothetical protein
MTDRQLERQTVLAGVWSLVSLETRQADGTVHHPLGQNLSGVLIYTAAGTVSAQLFPADRPRFASGDQEQATGAEIRAAFAGCTSYFGRYTVEPEASRVVHHVTASLYPNYEGQGLVRTYRLEGNRLEIATAPVRWGGSERVFVLVWERAE